MKHPTQLTIPEVVQALYAHLGGFEGEDAAEPSDPRSGWARAPAL